MNESEDLKKPDKELAGCYFFNDFLIFFSHGESDCACFQSATIFSARLIFFFGWTICGIVGGITSGIIIIWLFESSKEICWDNIKFLLVLFFFKLQLEREKLLKDIFLNFETFARKPPQPTRISVSLKWEKKYEIWDWNYFQELFERYFLNFFSEIDIFYAYLHLSV